MPVLALGLTVKGATNAISSIHIQTNVQCSFMVDVEQTIIQITYLKQKPSVRMHAYKGYLHVYHGGV